MEVIRLEEYRTPGGSKGMAAPINVLLAASVQKGRFSGTALGGAQTDLRQRS